MHAMVVTRSMETESRGGIGNFGIVGCHLYFIALKGFIVVMDISVVIICLDVTCHLPQ